MEKARIQIVEDEKIVAMDIQDRLESFDYNVSALAVSGEEAVKKAADTNPNLVLMDIMLKGDIDGIKAAQHIRAFFDIPVVFLTAYADENTLQRARIAEPFGYLLKPFEDKELHATIEMALYKHMMERKLKECENWYESTLHCICDAVIATNTDGCIKFMNPFAEALTDWKAKDAIGKYLNEIFNVVNGETNEKAEDPLIKIQRESIFFGLADYTMLIDKNNLKKPVDVIGASIKDKKGNAMGNVIIFYDITERLKLQKECLDFTKLS
jgi:PAS domain S-box-containing protein